MRLFFYHRIFYLSITRRGEISSGAPALERDVAIYLKSWFLSKRGDKPREALAFSPRWSSLRSGAPGIMLPSKKQHERSEPPACPADYVYVTSITRNYAYYGYVTSWWPPLRVTPPALGPAVRRTDRTRVSIYLSAPSHASRVGRRSETIYGRTAGIVATAAAQRSKLTRAWRSTYTCRVST